MRFLIVSHKHIFFTLLIKKPLKIGIKGNNLHIFLWHIKTQIKKKNIRNLQILKLGTPKKMTLQSQAKIKPSFSQYPILTIFNPKKVSWEQIYDFKF